MMATTKPADDTSDLPDWVRVGAKVAQFELLDYGQTPYATVLTVERLTAKQIILTGDRRYWRETLRPVGGGDARLLAVTDQRVRNAQALRTVRHLNNQIDDAMRGRCDTVEQAAERVERLAALVEQARQRIARLGDAGGGQ